MILCCWECAAKGFSKQEPIRKGKILEFGSNGSAIFHAKCVPTQLCWFRPISFRVTNLTVWNEHTRLNLKLFPQIILFPYQSQQEKATAKLGWKVSTFFSVKTDSISLAVVESGDGSNKTVNAELWQENGRVPNASRYKLADVRWSVQTILSHGASRLEALYSCLSQMDLTVV